MQCCSWLVVQKAICSFRPLSGDIASAIALACVVAPDHILGLSVPSVGTLQMHFVCRRLGTPRAVCFPSPWWGPCLCNAIRVRFEYFNYVLFHPLSGGIATVISFSCCKADNCSYFPSPEWRAWRLQENKTLPIIRGNTTISDPSDRANSLQL